MLLSGNITSIYQPWECEDFLSTWDSETPGARAPEESLLLNGIAIKIETKRHKSCTSDGKTSHFSYRYLPVESLSLDLQVNCCIIQKFIIVFEDGHAQISFTFHPEIMS